MAGQEETMGETPNPDVTIDVLRGSNLALSTEETQEGEVGA
jgi:hypothetical protein